MEVISSESLGHGCHDSAAPCDLASEINRTSRVPIIFPSMLKSISLVPPILSTAAREALRSFKTRRDPRAPSGTIGAHPVLQGPTWYYWGPIRNPWGLSIEPLKAPEAPWTLSWRRTNIGPLRQNSIRHKPLGHAGCIGHTHTCTCSHMYTYEHIPTKVR